MGVNIYSTDSTYWPWAGYRPVNMEHLTGVFVLGDSLDRSLINHAPGATEDADLIGRPTLVAGGLRTLAKQNYINTNVPNSASFTRLIVCKLPSAPVDSSTQCDLIGNLTGDTGGGIYVSADYRAAVQRGDPGFFTISNIAPSSMTAWRIIIHTVGGGLNRIDEHISGLSDEDAIDGAHVVADRPLLIGSSYPGTSRNGPLDVSLVLMWAAALTAGQRLAEAEAARRFVEARGVEFPS